MTDLSALAARVHARVHLTGEFRLRSGAISDTYFDKYRFEADPALLAEIAGHLSELAPLTTPGRVDALAGLELGGIPLATALSQCTGIPARFVRKEPKTYGTCRLAEGGEIAGLRLLIVEDVVTSAGQIVDSTRRLRDLGAIVEHAVCVIDREAGGVATLARESVELCALLTTTQLRAAAELGRSHRPAG